MKKILQVLVASFVAFQGSVADAHTMEEGEQFLEKALAEVIAVGPEAAARNFMTDAQWKQGSLYVVMGDFTGKLLAHSANPKMAGKDMSHARDAAGRLFVAEALHNLKTTGASVVEVKWGDPTTNRFAPAHMLSKQIPGRELYVTVMVFD